MRTVSGCLRATPVNHLPILSGIAPPTLRREAAVLALSRKAQANEDHLLHRMLQERPTRARLKSRRPISQQAHHLSDLAPPGVTKQSWLKTRWKDDWLAAPPWDCTTSSATASRASTCLERVDNPQPPSHGCTVQLVMLKWGLKDSSVCECGAPEQTVDHILDVCPHGREGIVSLDEDTRAWLASTSLEIWETYARRRKKTISKKTYPLNNGSMAKFFLFWLSHQIFTVEMNPTIWRNQLLKNYVDMWERKGKTGARRLTKQVVTRMNGLESVPNGCISSDTPQKMR